MNHLQELTLFVIAPVLPLPCTKMISCLPLTFLPSSYIATACLTCNQKLLLSFTITIYSAAKKHPGLSFTITFYSTAKKHLIQDTENQSTTAQSSPSVLNPNPLLPPISASQPSQHSTEQQFTKECANILHSIATESIFDFTVTSEKVFNPASNYPNQTFPTDFGHLLYQNDND